MAPPASSIASQQREPLLPLSSKNTTIEQFMNPDEDFPSVLRGKRILLATESFGPVNGVSRTTRSLVEYLRTQGANVAVVAPEIQGHGRGNNLAPADHRLTGHPLPYNPDLSVVYPFRVDRLFHRLVDPDIVYLASPASVGFQFLLQVRLLDAPPAVLCNFQTDLSAYAEIIFPAGMSSFAVWLLKVVQGYLFQSALVQTVFYPSSPIKDYLVKAGVSSDKLVHLGRGVDTDAFHPSFRDDAWRAELAPNGETIFVTVCRLAPEKGFKFLSQAVAALDAAGQPWKLLVVGGNRNPSVEEEVRRLFDGVRDNVVFTGFLTGAALARAYASADVFLHCSVTETFGLVVLEAMASGLPVVARDQGGPSEIVRHEKTGYLVPPKDLDGFVGRARELCRDAALRERLAAAARQAAIETTWDRINRTVAWHIAHALEKREKANNAALTGEWRPWGLRDQMSQFAERTGERIRLVLAVLIVSFFWLIAVMPIMLHGNFMFKRKQ